MSKSFKNYYESDDIKIKKQVKSHKQNRHKVRDFLKHIDEDVIDEDFDIEEEIEK